MFALEKDCAYRLDISGKSLDIKLNVLELATLSVVLDGEFVGGGSMEDWNTVDWCCVVAIVHMLSLFATGVDVVFVLP